MQLLKVVLDLRIQKSSKQNDKSTWCIPSFVSSNRFLETFFFRRFCMAAVVSYIFIVTKIVVSVVAKTTATCVYFIQIRHIFNNFSQTSTIHKQRHTPLQYTNITTLCLKYLYIGYEHNGFSFGDSVWNVPDVHVCHRANMVSSCFPCCRSGCLFFSVCFFWKTLALYGSPMVAFTSTHTFKAYEAVSSRTKRSCFLQHFTPRHKRLLCQHHGRRHKIPLQICVKE